MKIDFNAFLESLPIMGVGLLGIFIVTIVLIIGIYVLRAITAKAVDAEDTAEAEDTNASKADPSVSKESAMDLLKEREKKDFLDEVENNYISKDL
jgi:Na+-transporting methylmalonyl-CoA/oxaloacetate decarboxylase gamma subunit